MIMISPIQKLGTETPTTASVMIVWSIQVSCFKAEITPATSPKASVSTKAKPASATVDGRRSTMAVTTERPSVIDWPRSPWIMPPYQRSSCTWNGWSRPNCSRIRCTSLAGAAAPAITSAGSPGTICMMQKEMKLTRIRTTKVVISRLARYRPMARGYTACCFAVLPPGPASRARRPRSGARPGRP